MPDTYVIKDQFAPYFLTFQIVAWVDVFARQVYRDIVVDSFNFCVDKQNLNVHAWVIMSNHVHCILSSKNGELSNTIGNLKKYTSKQILKVAQEERESRREWMMFQFKMAARQHERNEHYQVWTHENHPEEISPFIKDMGRRKMDYIHNNPVRAGWVEKAEDYVYSSARDYMTDRRGLVKLEMW